MKRTQITEVTRLRRTASPPRRGRHSLSGFTGAALLFPALAQAFEAKDLLAFSAGPFVIRPRVGVAESYSDNIFFTPDGESAFTTGIMPGVDIRLGREDADRVFHLKYDFGQYWYHGVDTLDSASSHNLALTGRIQGRRLSSDTAITLSLADTVYGGYEGFSQGVLISSPNVERTSFGLNEALSYKLGEKTSTHTAFRLDIRDFPDPDPAQAARFFDQNRWRWTGGFGYQVRPKIQAIGEVYYGQTASEPNSPLRAKPAHLETVGGYAGATMEFTKRLRGTVKGGYEQSMQNQWSSAPEVDIGAPVASVMLTSAFTERLSGNLSYSRGTGVSIEGASVYTADNFGLQFVQTLGNPQRWVIGAGLTYGLNSYEETFISPGLSRPGTDATFLGINARVAYQFRTWLAASLSYQYSDRSTSGASQVDYTANEVTLSVSLGY